MKTLKLLLDDQVYCILYSFPKIHNSDFLFKYKIRPVFAGYNSDSLKTSQYLFHILSLFIINGYTVHNSYGFAKTFFFVRNVNRCCMASFDVDNF